MKMSVSLFLMLSLMLLPNIDSFKVLKSQIKVGSFNESMVSGARLLDERRLKVKDITLCIRFNLKVRHAAANTPPSYIAK